MMNGQRRGRAGSWVESNSASTHCNYSVTKVAHRKNKGQGLGPGQARRIQAAAYCVVFYRAELCGGCSTAQACPAHQTRLPFSHPGQAQPPGPCPALRKLICFTPSFCCPPTAGLAHTPSP